MDLKKKKKKVSCPKHNYTEKTHDKLKMTIMVYKYI